RIKTSQFKSFYRLSKCRAFAGLRGQSLAATAACGNGSRIARQLCMPMIDLYAVADLFPAHADRQLAKELSLALLKAEGVEKPGPTHLNNRGAYIHRMPPRPVNHAAVGAARSD